MIRWSSVHHPLYDDVVSAVARCFIRPDSAADPVVYSRLEGQQDLSHGWVRGRVYVGVVLQFFSRVCVCGSQVVFRELVALLIKVSEDDCGRIRG